MRDRFVLDAGAFVAWMGEAFGIRDRRTALARISEIDPLAERVVVDGLDYLIPDGCYQKIIEKA